MHFFNKFQWLILLFNNSGMSIRRNRRISLDRFDATWEGTYLLFKTLKSDEILDLQVGAEKATKEMEADPNNIELARKTINWAVDLLRNNFVSGMVFDADLVLEDGKVGGKREATVKDLDDFDYEVVKELAAEVSGNLPKN